MNLFKSRTFIISAIVSLLLGLVFLKFEASILSLVFSVFSLFAVLVLLYHPSIWIEDAFGAVSYKLKISSLVAGGLFLAISSSTPEFFTSFSGIVVYKIFDIGLATVLWSALFNLCIIIGICSLIKSPLTVDPRIYKRDMPFYGVSIILLLLLALDKSYSSYYFLILICLYIVYVISLFFDKSKPYSAVSNQSWKSIILKLVFGILLISVLSHLLVTFGLRTIKLSEELFEFIFPISLLAAIVFAPGTSISDLLMSISATRKGEDSVGIVNGIASNTFDLCICLGVPGFIYTSMTGKKILINIFDSGSIIIILVIGYVLTFLFIYSEKKVHKGEGVVLIAYFVGSIVYLLFNV